MGNAMKTRRSKSSDAMPPRIRDRIIVFKALQANEKTLVLLRWWDFREEKLKKMTAEDFKNGKPIAFYFREWAGGSLLEKIEWPLL